MVQLLEQKQKKNAPKCWVVDRLINQMKVEINCSAALTRM